MAAPAAGSPTGRVGAAATGSPTGRVGAAGPTTAFGSPCSGAGRPADPTRPVAIARHADAVTIAIAIAIV